MPAILSGGRSSGCGFAIATITRSGRRDVESYATGPTIEQRVRRIADVARGHEPVRRDLSLYSKVPLLHARHARIGVEGIVDSVSRIGYVLAQSEWERNTAGEIAVRIVETTRGRGYENLSAPRRALSGSQVQFYGANVIEDSIAGANHHLSIFGWIP